MKAKITYWREQDGFWLGYLNDYPDHWTQGEDLDDLKAHLRNLFQMFGAEAIPGKPPGRKDCHLTSIRHR
jgi:predicted RNase H-like HicB family nuclease